MISEKDNGKANTGILHCVQDDDFWFSRAPNSLYSKLIIGGFGEDFG
jgi:hypothetical protein